jgi:hypothetical protein
MTDQQFTTSHQAKNASPAGNKQRSRRRWLIGVAVILLLGGLGHMGNNTDPGTGHTSNVPSQVTDGHLGDASGGSDPGNGDNTSGDTTDDGSGLPGGPYVWETPYTPGGGLGL